MHRSVRPVGAALLALGLVSFPARSARAQTGSDCRLQEWDPCPDGPPMVGIQPQAAEGSYALPVTLHWLDDFRLDFGTRRITFNGTDVGASFTTPYTDGLKEAYSQATLTLTGGADTLVARICDVGVDGDTRCTEERAGVAFVPAVEAALPQGDGEIRNVADFAANLSYTTPAYFSRDAARAVTLFYSSAQADPLALVQVDVPAGPASPPDRLSLKVRDAAGAFVPLRSGGDEVFFAGGAGPSRLTAQLATGSLATGAHAYTAVVRRWRETGVTDEAVPVRVLVVDESASRFGRGWSIVGAQRLQVAADGGRTVTEGDGTILYFQRACGTCDHYLPPRGEYSTLHYLPGPTPYYERRYVDGRVAVFSATGLLQTLRDPDGAQTAFAYSGTRLASITDPAGKQIVFEADAAGYVDAVHDAAGRRSVLAYTGTALTRITGPAGVAALRPAYDAAGRLTGWIDRHGGTWNVALDAAATVDSLMAPAVTVDGGATVRPVTRLRSPVLASLPPAGKGTALAPAPRVHPDSVWAESADPRGHLTRTRVDRAGRALRAEEPLGFWTEVTRDAHGRPVMVRTSSGQKTTYAYDGFGQLVEEADSVSGRRVRWTYDAATHALLAVTGDGPARSFAYDGGRVVRTTRAGYGTTRHVYAGGRLSRLVHPDGSSTAYAYETAWGNVASVTDSTLSGKRATRYTYDDASRLRTVADTSGTSTTEHDALNRPTRRVDRDGSVTTIAYPGAGTVVTDPLGRVHTLTRNALEWLVSETRPGSSVPIAYGYDRGGNVTSITNRRGQKTSFTHDARGRPLTRAAGGATAAYAYDNPAGRWIAAQNAESTDTLRFDASGRVTSSVTVMAGRRFERRYAYNARGQRTRMDFPAVGDSLVFRYDDAYRLTGIKPLGTGWTTRVTYDAEGRIDSLVSPSGLARTFLHTPWGEPEWVRFSAPALDSLFGHELAFDVRGRLESRGRRHDDAERLRLFEHDRAGRLTHWHDEERLFQERCEPDVYGHVVCQTDTLRATGASETFVYDSAGNRRNGTTLHPGTHRYATFGGLALTWDADGNLLARVGRGVADTLAWDALGQLASVRRAGVSVTYGYNAFGERVRRTEGTQTRRTLYDDGDDLLAEIDGSGTVVAAYTHLPGIDRPFSVATAGALRYFVAESPGTVVGLLDDWGATAAARHRYTPFGAPQSGSDLPAPLGFMGRERDAATGMYYMRNRWYDPALERFVSEDPIGLEGGVHPYRFARNAPTGLRDPSGLYVCVDRNVWETVPGFEDTLEAATGTHVMRDPDGCIRHATANSRADPRLRWNQETFLQLVRRRDVRYNIKFAGWFSSRRTSGFGPVVAGAREYTATILRSEIGQYYDACEKPLQAFAMHTLSSLLVHELLGHGYTTLRRELVPATEQAAIFHTNRYLSYADMPVRCRHEEP